MEEEEELHHTHGAVAEWIIDSGATHHMCSSEDLLLKCWRTGERRRILLGDGRDLEVTLEGDARVKIVSPDGVEQEATIKNVLVVPGISRNLLSVTQCMKQGISFEFDAKAGRCLVRACNRVVAFAYHETGLWKLQTSTRDVPRLLTGSLTGNLNVWHLRFNHLGEENLKKLARLQMVTGIEEELAGTVRNTCEGCLLGKQTRLPFGESTRRASARLQVIHSDVEGPLNVYLCRKQIFCHLH